MKRLISAKKIQPSKDDFDKRWDKKFNKYYDFSAKTITMTYNDYVKFAEEVKNFE